MVGRSLNLLSNYGVTGVALAQELDVFLAHHPAVHHPDSLGNSVFGLHRLDDLFDGCYVCAIARENFVGERQPFGSHEQADADLFAVGALVLAVTARRLRVLRLSFKVSALSGSCRIEQELETHPEP